MKDETKAETLAVQTIPCALCGEVEIVIVEREKWDLYMGGSLVQNVWPEKDAGWREVLRTGIHSECYNKMCEGMD